MRLALLADDGPTCGFFSWDGTVAQWWLFTANLSGRVENSRYEYRRSGDLMKVVLRTVVALAVLAAVLYTVSVGAQQHLADLANVYNHGG
ncbi:hypothetical protein [Virgisporangium aurantiacum]|uniref:Uncharacterized protein n=1 Tax=Virgisporangium aurantiacum TaxID=175570 RepID=A0A8J3ZJI2_9ACTN|nr:hypothetical protein [Virgisporangium aurantiacum]GIJ64921.1 hypothetical protein Vau01_124370 [Virgisporangium aurantiacum]